MTDSMTKDKSTGVDSFSSDESKARSIVLMLILRKRLAKKLLDRYSYVSEENRLQLYAHYSEAHNAAESARCTLAS